MPRPKRKPVRKKSAKKRTPSKVMPISSGESSVNVEKIENGFLVSVSKSTRNRYVRKQYFAENEAKAKEIVSKAI
jgi:hypothetical protein